LGHCDAAEAILLGFQHFLVMLGTTVLIPTALVPQMGGGNVSSSRLNIFKAVVNNLIGNVVLLKMLLPPSQNYYKIAIQFFRMRRQESLELYFLLLVSTRCCKQCLELDCLQLSEGLTPLFQPQSLLSSPADSVVNQILQRSCYQHKS